MFDTYPKDIILKCYHTPEGKINNGVPNQELCASCAKWQEYYHRKYKELTNNL